MAKQASHTRSQGVDRRGFLVSAATVACTGVISPAEQSEGAGPYVVHIGRSERARSDIESWNVGLITAFRRERTAGENNARDAELRIEISRHRFGVLFLRGRYIENCRSACARETDECAYLIFSNNDDSGNLKGFLRKYGKKYGQESVIHKGYYRDAHLHALRDLPVLGMNDGDAKSLGLFHPDRLGALYTLMTRGDACAPSLPLNDLGSDCDGVDWLGGRWEDIGLWTPKSFFSRAERRVVFDEAGLPRVRS